MGLIGTAGRPRMTAVVQRKRYKKQEKDIRMNAPYIELVINK